MELDTLDHLVLLYAARDALIERASHAEVIEAAANLRAAFPDDPLVPMLDTKARRILVIEDLPRQSLAGVANGAAA